MEILDRRRFLVSMLGAGATAGVAHVTGLRGLMRLAEATTSSPASSAGPLVLCTLYGGNDGLNTVPPYATGTYHDWRGSLAISEEEALPLGEYGGIALGLHPAMPSLQSLFKAGKVAVICGVEYPDPSFSHFQSEDIWQTAELVDQESGWLGRWLDLTGTDPFRALSVGPTLPPALVGTNQQASSLVDSTGAGSQLPGQGNTLFEAAYSTLMSSHTGRTAWEVGQATAGSNLIAVGSKADAALKAETPPAIASGRDAGDIGNQLRLVAELIEYGLPTSVYSVSWGSFDTHSNQAPVHANVLGSLDAAIEAFFGAFPTASPGKSPVMLVTSEFGRTPKANASGGTDHSTASVVFAIGPSVKGGFYGAVPSFSNLDQYGNQIFTTDFRSVYATVLESLLQFQPSDILGSGWSSLGFV